MYGWWGGGRCERCVRTVPQMWPDPEPATLTLTLLVALQETFLRSTAATAATDSPTRSSQPSPRHPRGLSRDRPSTTHATVASLGRLPSGSEPRKGRVLIHSEPCPYPCHAPPTSNSSKTRRHDVYSKHHGAGKGSGSRACRPEASNCFGTLRLAPPTVST